jgi:hypothetical protein
MTMDEFNRLKEGDLVTISAYRAGASYGDIAMIVTKGKTSSYYRHLSYANITFLINGRLFPGRTTFSSEIDVIEETI